MPERALANATVLTLPDGRRVWRASLTSPLASSIRVHVREYSGEGGQLWVYAPPDASGVMQADGPFSNQGPFNDGDFWTAEIDSPTITLEFLEGSANSSTRLPPFQIESIVHVWAQPSAATEDGLDAPALEALARPSSPATEEILATQEGACHLDVTCYSAYQSPALGVVQYTFLGDDGSYYNCSGAMINTRNQSFKPYLLTANHCIGSNTEARSMQVRFRYQTSTCNGTPPTRNSVPSVTGATFLKGGDILQGDYTLVLLSSNPPQGTTFLGWDSTANALSPDGSAVGIHHPDGTYKRIAFGSRVADRDVSIGGTSASGALFYRIQWSQGRTEGGSSGSPLLNANGQILGTLTYGPVPRPGQSVCDISPMVAGYARFSNAYAALKDYLEETAAPSLSVTPTSLSFTAANGVHTGAALQTLTFRTPSATPVTFSLSASAAWIKLSAPSGSLTSSSPASIGVSIDLSFFNRTASSSGTISVTSGTLTPIVISVEANVTVSGARVSMTIDPNPVNQQPADADGFSWFYGVALTETGGVFTRLTSFKIDGLDYTASIPAWFGSDILPAGGRLTAQLRSRGLAVPRDRLYEVTGIDSSGAAWATQAIASFQGRATRAVLSLDSAPTLIRQNPDSSACPWYQELILRETAGFDVTLSAFTAGGADLSSSLASYWGGMRLSANGTLRAEICWTSIQLPSTLAARIDGVDSNGQAVSASVSATFAGPPASAARMTVSPPSVVLNATTGFSTAVNAAFDLSITGGIAAWTGRLLFADGRQSSRLTVAPLSGIGSTNLRVTAPPGAPPGVYEATLVLQCTDAAPQVLNVPIKFIVGAESGGPSIHPSGLVNNASYQAAAAPGMILSVFGERLSQGIEAASSLPLPTNLQGTSAFVNGRPAPFYYVSPGQLNLQIPYETEIGTATLTVTVSGQSTSQQFQVASTAPAIYTTNGRIVVPAGEIARGDTGVLFITGQGVTAPPVETGNAPAASTPLDQLPAPVAPVSVTVGGLPATISFAGNPYFVAGLTQINYQPAADTPAGLQPVVVRVGDKLSPQAYVIVK